ncbi:MAG: hypothetical protein ABIL25_05365 [candidate division WOR-3 bacterium]
MKSVAVMIFFCCVACLAVEVRPLFEVGLWDMALGGVNIEGKTVLGVRTSLFRLGCGIRVHEHFGTLIAVDGVRATGLFTERFEKPYISYAGFGPAAIAMTAFWFPKSGARARKPFAFLSYAWIHTKLKDIREDYPITDEFPRNAIALGVGYTLYAVTPRIELAIIPGWSAVSYTVGVQSGGIFDW